MNSVHNLPLTGPGITFTPEPGKSAPAGKTGKVLEVVTSEASMTVRTEFGQFTLSGPALPENASRISKDDLIAAQGSLESKAPSLAADVHALLEMLLTLSLQQRHADRENRDATLNAQLKAIQSQADEIRKAAAWALAAGIAMGAAQIGGGFINIKGGMKGIDQSLKGKDLLAQGEMKIADGHNLGAQGLGQIASSALTMISKQHEAKQKEAEAQQTKARALYDQANDFLNDAKEMIRLIQQKVEAMDQSENESLKSAFRA